MWSDCAENLEKRPEKSFMQARHTMYSLFKAMNVDRLQRKIRKMARKNYPS